MRDGVCVPIPLRSNVLLLLIVRELLQLGDLVPPTRAPVNLSVRRDFGDELIPWVRGELVL